MQRVEAAPESDQPPVSLEIPFELILQSSTSAPRRGRLVHSARATPFEEGLSLPPAMPTSKPERPCTQRTLPHSTATYPPRGGRPLRWTVGLLSAGSPATWRRLKPGPVCLTEGRRAAGCAGAN